jgi:pimeloyl-ACP methyl ester carboxylesterase
LLCAAVLAAGCGGGEDERPASTPKKIDGVVKIDGDRGLYVRCSGSGSPTVVMEAGDVDTSASYDFAVPAVSKATRVCVYDRANLGASDPDPGPRGLDELVGDLEGLLEAAEIAPPYVLVGTSGGGYIATGYAVRHRDAVAGLVLVETAEPFRNPPKPIVEETDPEHPDNVEQRDYLQVEKDAWNARTRIGDVPVKVISAKPRPDEIASSPFPSERRALRSNVEGQKGWLVLSPRAEQIVVDSGHAVEEEDPQLVIDTILEAVAEAGD